MLVQYIIDNFDDFTIIEDKEIYKLDHKYSNHISQDLILIYLTNIHINKNMIYYDIKNLNIGVNFRNFRKIENKEFLEFIKLKLI